MSASSTATPPSTWPHADSATRYGTVSRWFHWGMALCFAVVFAAALAHYFLPKSDIEGLLWPLHRPVGAFLMLLVVLRAAWALLNAGQRPPHVSRAAHLGHLALYALTQMQRLAVCLLPHIQPGHGGQFGRGGGGGGAHIGAKVGNGEVGFVPDAHHNRHGALHNGVCQLRVVEGP